MRFLPLCTEIRVNTYPVPRYPARCVIVLTPVCQFSGARITSALSVHIGPQPEGDLSCHTRQITPEIYTLLTYEGDIFHGDEVEDSLENLLRKGVRVDTVCRLVWHVMHNWNHGVIDDYDARMLFSSLPNDMNRAASCGLCSNRLARTTATLFRGNVSRGRSSYRLDQRDKPINDILHLLGHDQQSIALRLINDGGGKLIIRDKNGILTKLYITVQPAQPEEVTDDTWYVIEDCEVAEAPGVPACPPCADEPDTGDWAGECDEQPIPIGIKAWRAIIGRGNG